MSDIPSAWILRPRPNEGASLRLFCFPHAGASGMVFRTWPQDLPDVIEVCAVELPGRGRRIAEAPISQLGTLVAELVGAMLPKIDRSFALFGHSFGALVCFEIARELQNHQGISPVHLCVSGLQAPQLLADESSIHKQPEAVIIDQVRKMGGTPEAVLEDDELVAALLPAIWADYAMLETYKFTEGKPLSCPILAMAGSADLRVDRASLQAWGEQTTAGFKVEMVPGDHFYLFQSQPQALRILGKALEQAFILVEHK